MTAPIRSGFVGGGFMGAVHSRSARAAGARLVAIASSSPARAEQAAAALGIERAEADANALANADDIDVVHVCSPNRDHPNHTLAALGAGKHVICEKPLAITAAQAGALVAAADAAGCVGVVPFVYRYHPMARQARALVADGALGVVLSIDACYLQDWLLAPTDQNWRTDAAAGGSSRAFADIGSHLCDLIEFVTGSHIARLSARTRTVYTERSGAQVANEDIAALVVELDQGALGTLLVSQLAPGRKNALTLELHGAEASVRFEQERPEELWVGRRAGSNLRLRDPDADAPSSARISTLPTGHALGYQDAFNALVADAYATIGGDLPDGLPTFADGHRAAVITEMVLASAAAGGGWVDVTP